MKATTACAMVNSVLYLSIAVMVLGLYYMNAGGDALWPLWLALFQMSTSSK